jgi:hypothetical protein
MNKQQNTGRLPAGRRYRPFPAFIKLSYFFIKLSHIGAIMARPETTPKHSWRQA